MPYIFSMPRPGLGYEPGQPVSEEFAVTHPGMVSLVPPSKPASVKSDPEEEDSDE